MADDNPYAPPTHDAPPPQLSSGDDPQDLAKNLNGLSRWQRIAAILLYALAAVSLASTSMALRMSGRWWSDRATDGFVSVILSPRISSLIITGLLIAGAARVQSASTQLARAARTGAQAQLERGFRRIGGYLILQTAFSLLLLAMTLVGFWAFSS